MPCSGFPSERCGGDQKMNVYHITGEGSSDERTTADEGTTPDISSRGEETDSSTHVTDEPAGDNYVGCYADDRTARALTLADTARDDMSYEVSRVLTRMRVFACDVCAYPTR